MVAVDGEGGSKQPLWSEGNRRSKRGSPQGKGYIISSGLGKSKAGQGKRSNGIVLLRLLKQRGDVNSKEQASRTKKVETVYTARVKS